MGARRRLPIWIAIGLGIVIVATSVVLFVLQLSPPVSRGMMGEYGGIFMHSKGYPFVSMHAMYTDDGTVYSGEPFLDGIGSCSFSPDGKHYLLVGQHYTTVTVGEVENPSKYVRVGALATPAAVGDGGYWARALDRSFGRGEYIVELRVGDAPPVATAELGSSGVAALLFVPRSATVVILSGTAGQPSATHMIDVSRLSVEHGLQRVGSFIMDGGRPTSCSLSANGDSLILGSTKGQILVISLGIAMVSIKANFRSAHSGEVSCIAVSDGTGLGVSCGLDGKVCRFSLSSPDDIISYEIGQPLLAIGVRGWSAQFVRSDGVMEVIDVRTGEREEVMDLSK